MPGELHIPYSQLKPLAPKFELVKEAANRHIMNEYDGIDTKDPTAGKRRTRAQFLDFGRMYGPDQMEKLIKDLG